MARKKVIIEETVCGHGEQMANVEMWKSSLPYQRRPDIMLEQPTYEQTPFRGLHQYHRYIAIERKAYVSSRPSAFLRRHTAD